MSYRMLLSAGAAVGLLAGGAAAQIGQQQQQQQPRQVSPINGKDFLNDLEGEWNVEVKVFNIDLLEGVDAVRTPGLTQFRMQIEQLMIREGVDQDEARSASRNLIQTMQQQRPDREALTEKIQEALEDAGVSEDTAQREAQRLAQQFHQQLQQRGIRWGQPGQRPGAGQQPGRRVGQQPGQRPGQRPGIGQMEHEGDAQYTGEGTATRSWKLNELYLHEELSFTIEVDDENNNPQHEAGEGRINLRNGDEFEAAPVFAFEPENGDLVLVWGDNTRSMLHYAIGQYDSAEQSMVFYTIDTDQIQMPHSPARPGITPTPRPGIGGPQVERDRPGQRPGMQDRPGMRDRHGVGQQQMRLQQEGARISLRIVDENEHVVTVYRSNPGGQATRVAELTYTRGNNND